MSYQRSAFSFQLSAFSFQLSAISFQQSTIRYLLLAVTFPRPIVPRRGQAMAES